MDGQIPEYFLQVTQSSTSDILEDGSTLITLCTSSGQLLELVNNKVIDSCDIDRVADKITTFTSYDPLQKYYLLHCQSNLVVVNRSKPLSVIKTYGDVVDVKIQDRLKIGRPQVVISTQTDKEPIITDFVGQLQSASTAPHVVPLLTASLSGKLQEMNARVAKARRLLQERRSARCKALHRFTPHLHRPDSETDCEPKVLAWGPPPPPQRPVTDPPLLLSHPWTRIHNGQWIIGVPVFNATTTAVCDVRLRLRLSSAGVVEPQLRYRSLVVGFEQRSSCGAEWTEPRLDKAPMQRLVEVTGRSTAVVVGVLQEPLFKKSSVVSISGAIVYKTNNQPEGANVQDVLSDEVYFKVEDLIQGSLVPFSSQNTPEESDLISVIVSSQCWQLCASPRHRMSAPLAEALAKAGLVQVKELGCWVGRSLDGGSLAGLVVSESGITGGGYVFHVYAREPKQALHLVHSLQGNWNMELCKGKAATVQDCVTSLRAELRMLHSITGPGAEYTADTWSQIRNKLSKLELATDISFASHAPL